MNEYLIERVTPGTRFRMGTLFAWMFFGSLILPVIFVTGSHPPEEKVLDQNQVIRIYAVGASTGAVTSAVGYLATVGIGRMLSQGTTQKNDRECK
ncbi:hypothetical protein [Planctomicrobium piriforme]|uniref:Uncharacterized protein n=1 Tax=Planctomicrobium piriforme TaxID=1576369 RepID=A0A1I3DIT4_9PLAN|nr:hypothetical protein [Planctomicrobium piriforme]SFH86553.1 hypothetical protein SAMN05421753_103259 [Planctomicrobium piriforme]